MSTIVLTPLDMALAGMLLVANAAASIIFRLGLERPLLLAALRMLAQLLIAGIVLKIVFQQCSPWLTALAALVMVLAAGWEAQARQHRRLAGFSAFGLGTGTLGVVGFLVALYAMLAVVRPEPWYAPRYLIPILGMILGNAMTSTALAGDRLQSELRMRTDEIEAMLALGFSGREAVQPMVRSALRAAMLPTVTGMMTVGLVQLPGMMTGQILAGSSPLVAIEYQIVVMFMLAVASSTAALLFVRLAARRYLTPAHQLRRELL